MLLDAYGNPVTTQEAPSEPQGVSVHGPDYTSNPALDMDLRDHPDAIQCTAGQHLYVPEKFDGEYIVHVMRLQGDPPGAPGQAVCPRCMNLLFDAKVITRDVIKGYGIKH